MLPSHIAIERLKQFEDERGGQVRLLASAALPLHLRGIAFALLDRNDFGVDAAQPAAITRRRRGAATALEGLNAGERLRVLSALFPRLAPHVEIAWQNAKRDPYQADFLKRAFRAPRHPSATLPARTAWLCRLIRVTQHYPQDAAWFAAWAPYLGRDAPALGNVFAAAIDSGGEEGQAVYDVLCASARGEHPVGAMGPHVTRGVLRANRPEGWALLGEMARASDGDERLRQSILDAADAAHPQAFRHILRLMAERNLANSDTAPRALNAWLGTGWTEAALAPGQIRAIAGRLLILLDDAGARRAALAGNDPQDIYFALWAMAFEDAPAMVPRAASLMVHRDAAARAAAVRLLAMLRLTTARAALVSFVADPDLRVAALAVEGIGTAPLPADLVEGDLFERLAYLLPRIGAPRRRLPPIIWSWLRPVVSRESVARLLRGALGKRPAARLAALAKAVAAPRAHVDRRAWSAAAQCPMPMAPHHTMSASPSVADG